MGSNPIIRTAYLAKWIRQTSNKRYSIKATSYIGVWCNGSTSVSNTASEGSNPSTPALFSPAVRGGQTVSKTVVFEANEVGSIPTGAAICHISLTVEQQFRKL